MAPETQINIANIVPCTLAEGPGKRFAIWVQGCPLRCAECCNPDMLSFDGGTPTTIGKLSQQIIDSKSLGVEGVTLIGGEPFAHAEALAELTAYIQQAGLSVMVFSGFTLTELKEMNEPAATAFLQNVDLLVDGRYDRSQPDTSRRWVGSKNQQVHFLSDRYSPTDDTWKAPDTLEVRWDGRNLVVNGFPAKSAVGLWKRGSGN